MTTDAASQAADLGDRLHDYLNRRVAAAVVSVHEGINRVRAHCEQVYADAATGLARHQAEPFCACGDCRERRATQRACRDVIALLPSPAVSIERRAEPGEEVTGHARHESDPGRRPGAVTGGSDSGN